MTAKDWSREIAALTPYVKGHTLEMAIPSRPQVPGTTVVRRTNLLGFDGLHEVNDGTVDGIVAITALETVADTIKCLREWRRALREQGKLALVLEYPSFAGSSNDLLHRFTPAFLSGIVNLVGGFIVERVEPIVEGETWLMVAQRSSAALVRMPLGTLGPELAAAAAANDVVRGELYFQLGTLLLQAGDPALAESAFKTLLQLEPSNADGMFGLGMCYGTLGRWSEALTQLLQVASREPSNVEVQRWLTLARDQVKARRVR